MPGTCRFSWQCGSSCPLLTQENSVKGPSGTGDYVGPHFVRQPCTLPSCTFNCKEFWVWGNIPMQLIQFCFDYSSDTTCLSRPFFFSPVIWDHAR